MAGAGSEYCDLVMKGGITSGIVYPNAVLALAKRYRFKNIGGTSAGAIAAAATAAAALGERRRRHDDQAAIGFAALEGVAAQLKERGFIFGLFQPVFGSRAAFHMIITLAARPGMGRTVTAILRGILATAPLETLAALTMLLLVGFLIGGLSGALGAALPALACVFFLGSIAALFRIGRVLRKNAMGMCPGTRTKRRSKPALSEWLHEALQTLSGQQGRPLLFEDLWDAPRFESEPGDKAITLEMITTGISHQEPRSLPFEKSSFWFLREEFEPLFPREVVDWMADQDKQPIEIDERRYYRLPEQGKLPVLVAARMSLSFPLLISAVPLHEPDWSRRPPPADAEVGGAECPRTSLDTTEALSMGGARRNERPAAFRTCWFSDGGIGSNFPIHLFDAPLPRWPTFAIDLIYPKTRADEPQPDIFLPTENNQGWQRSYRAIESDVGLAQVLRFLFGIVDTMQNWRDLLQSRAPGHRDRIVRIPLLQDEGGMNLDMPQAALDRIAEKGHTAGEVLAAQFDFDNHWWVRWRNVASAVERFTIAFAKAASADPAPSYAKACTTAFSGEPEPPSYPFTSDQMRDASSRLREMVDQGELWADTDPNLTKGAPRQLPQLRIVPTF